MAITLKYTNGTTATATSLPVGTTSAGDTIVVVVSTTVANWSNGSSTLPNNTNVTWTGHGGTVTSYALNSSTSIGYAVWIITNCSAGVSNITRSGTPPSTTGGYAVAVFSGVATSSAIASNSPIIFTTTNNSSASTTVSYTAGQLLLGAVSAYTYSTTTGTWNGTADTLATSFGSFRIPVIDYLVAPSTQTSVTYTTPRSSPTQVLNGAIAFVLNPLSAISGTGTTSSTFSSSGTAIVTTNATGATSSSFSATATGTVSVPATGSSSSSFSSSSTGTVSVSATGTSTSSFASSGAGTVVVVYPGTGSSSSTFSSSASGLVDEPGTARSSFEFSSSAIGQVVAYALGALSEEFSSNAIGTVTFVYSGTGSTASSFTSSAIGLVVFVSAPGSVSVGTKSARVGTSVKSPTLSVDTTVPSVRTSVAVSSVSGDTTTATLGTSVEILVKA